MLEDFQQLEIFRPSIFDVAGNLFVALICGLIISIVYRFTYRGPSYSPNFVISIVMLTMITAIVILVIGNNLARAFGLVGAMSIIRFRTAVRDTLDIIFIFLALSIGMAAGVGLLSMAIIATLMICSVLIILVFSNYAAPKKRQHLLQLAYSSDDENERLLNSAIKKYCRKLKLVNLKNLGRDNDIEAFYHIVLKDSKKKQQFIRSLNELGFVNNINMYFDDDITGGSPNPF